MLSPEQFLVKAAEDQAAQQRASLDYAEVISQHDNLAKKIVADLAAVEAEFDALQGIDDLIASQGKQNAQIITGLLKMRVVGNVSTMKAHVENARKSIIAKG